MKPPIGVVRICRYPVKGLSSELLERVALSPGKCLPQDRRLWDTYNIYMIAACGSSTILQRPRQI